MSRLEVKTERDVNLVTHKWVLRIMVRRSGERRWHRFVVVPSKTEPLHYLEEHAEEIAAKWIGGGSP